MNTPELRAACASQLQNNATKTGALNAFVAASFKNMHISAKLAFLVLGPMLDIKLLLMYTRVFRPRLIATIVICVVVQVLFLCLLVHLVYQAMGWTGLPGLPT